MSNLAISVIRVLFTLKVRCLEDYGEFETEEGTVVLLKKNSQVCNLCSCVGWYWPSKRAKLLGINQMLCVYTCCCCCCLKYDTVLTSYVLSINAGEI